jgi:2-methylcitrate dehydratase PrpD
MTTAVAGHGGAELAAFLADHRSWLTDRHRDRARAFLSDTIGCMLHGACQPWARAAARHARRAGGDGGCLVVGDDAGTSPAMAAFANGVAAHAFELDDVHEEAISHPGAVVVPAVLATAQHLGSTGRAVLDATVVGYEAMGRVGIAVGPAAHMRAGFHPTGQSGVFGAAAAVGALLGLDAAGLLHAFGLAASFASGTTEFSQTGGMSKRLHAGRAAEGGLTAASLAADGVEGPTGGLDGRYGFCRIFTTAPRVGLLTTELGQRWMIDEITVKPYAACSDIHPLIDAALDLRAAGVDPAAIKRIEADVPSKAAEQNAMDGTTSVMAAQYSGPFNIAAAFLADPADPATYAADRIADPRLAALQARVTSLRPCAAFDSTYAWKLAGRLRVRMVDGTTMERTVSGQRGSMHQPLTAAELRSKLRRLVGDHAVLDGVERAVAALPTADDMADLVRALGQLPCTQNALPSRAARTTTPS